jgi:lipopolysaccharide/colanic/teichoic acid biosynthesis glycosyltransferase
VRNLGVDARVLVDLYRPAHAHPFVEELFALPFYGVSPALTRQGALAVKRAVDVAGATLLLVLICPVLAVIALLIKVSSRGPIIFAQERSGFHGRAFRMYKFRTMVPGAEQRRATCCISAERPVRCKARTIRV